MRFYQRCQVPIPAEERPERDGAWTHRELRCPGVTLELLHFEYLEQHSHGLHYSAFCELSRIPRAPALSQPTRRSAPIGLNTMGSVEVITSDDEIESVGRRALA